MSAIGFAKEKSINIHITEEIAQIYNYMTQLWY